MHVELIIIKKGVCGEGCREISPLYYGSAELWDES
jgi:hypothetical protein